MNDIQKMQSIIAGIGERRKGKSAPISEKIELSIQGKLPYWGEERRGTPNSFIRSALFAAIQSKDREFFKSKVLASQGGITVKFTGEQLNQEDLSIWQALVHMSRKENIGTSCKFSAYSILKLLNISTGGEQHKMLHSSILRLTACAVEITHDNKTYIGSLIYEAFKDEESKNYKVVLNEKLNNIFGKVYWTGIDWDQRSKLKGKPLAQALHAFYSSHKNPFVLKIETIRDYVGSSTKNIHRFRIALLKALDELIAIGFLEKYYLVNGGIRVEKSSSEKLSTDNNVFRGTGNGVEGA